jgi:hypothetical protein
VWFSRSGRCWRRCTRRSGDYSALQTALNLISPQGQRPVHPADAADIPIEARATRRGSTTASKGSYYVWQQVSLDPSTGAKCADGSPYKIFVNRSPATSNVLISQELGGACCSYETCQSINPLGATSLPALISQLGNLVTQFLSTGHIDGLTAINNSVTVIEPLVLASGLGSTLINRSATELQNKVQELELRLPAVLHRRHTARLRPHYLHVGRRDETVVYQHNGIRSSLAALVWIKNNLEKPGQMMLTGQSAGGVSSTASYFLFRNKLRPTYGYLLDDAGPAFPAPLAASDVQYPSIRLHKRESPRSGTGTTPCRRRRVGRPP